MKATETIRIHHRSADTFARVPHATTEDARLSWNAKGILTYLLGKPPGWKTRVADIRKKGKDGERAIRSGLKELRACGYVNVVPVRESGRIVEWQWQVADIPMFSPDVRNEDVENAHVQNSHHSKKEKSKNQFSKNESEEAKETPVASQHAVSPSFPPKWKPDPRTKEQKLASIPTPKHYPSEREFDSYLQCEEANGILEFKDTLYSDLCDNKWHHWNKKLAKWSPIRDWKKYVLGLDETITEARTARR